MQRSGCGNRKLSPLRWNLQATDMFKLGQLRRPGRKLPYCPEALEVAPGVRASVHENGILLLHIPTGRIFQSNRIGAKIWQGVSGGWKPSSICAEISCGYGVAPDLVAQHAASFLKELEQKGFVTRTRHTGGLTKC